MPRVVHFEIHASDMDRAERFYIEAFGWTVQRWQGPVDYRLLMTGSEKDPGINGALVGRRPGEASDGGAVNGYVCTVAVESIEEAESKIAAAGGVQVVDRQTIPGVGDLSYFKDTEGNIFGALQPSL
jgi:predicted enzyme related to lactoylglutathione lyase